MDRLAQSKRTIIETLKRHTDRSASELAEALDVTPTAIRQHLVDLERSGLVSRRSPTGSGGRGRPAMRFALTGLGDDLFPDRHRDLSVELLDAIAASGGPELLESVIEARTTAQRARYRAAVGDAGETPVAVRVERLASLRTSEGYLAESTADDDGFVLTEHHCPICDAATSCRKLCRDELELFDDVLGPDVAVERVSHLLSGDSRCAYRVTPR